MHKGYDEHECTPKAHSRSHNRLCLRVKLPASRNDTIYWASFEKVVTSVFASFHYHDRWYQLYMFTLDYSRAHVQFIYCIYRITYSTLYVPSVATTNTSVLATLVVERFKRASIYILEAHPHIIPCTQSKSSSHRSYAPLVKCLQTNAHTVTRSLYPSSLSSVL